MTTRILVTGGAGFIGSHYVQALLSAKDADPVEVTVLDALTYAGRPENLDPVRTDPRLAFVHGDVRDAALVDRLLADHDQVVHLAAETHVDRSIAGAADFVTTNVVGTHTLLDAAVRHRIAVFVLVSTDEVYGSIDSGSWPETDPLRPNSPTRPRRRPLTCWRWPSTARTAWTCGSPAAPTTTGRGSSPRSSSRCS